MNKIKLNTIEEAIEDFRKGEIVIVVSGAPEPVKEQGASKNKYRKSSESESESQAD